jgi:hypothetical protein
MQYNQPNPKLIHNYENILLPVDLILNQPNPAYILTKYFCKMCFKTVYSMDLWHTLTKFQVPQ